MNPSGFLSLEEADIETDGRRSSAVVESPSISTGQQQLARLLTRLDEYICGLSRKYAFNQDDQSDLQQQARLTICEAFKVRCEKDDRYFARVAYYATMRAVKERHRQSGHEVQTSSSWLENQSVQPDFSAEIIDRLSAEEHLESLAPNLVDRAALRLVALGRLTYDEAASVLKTSARSIDGRLQRIRASAREQAMAA